MKTSRTVSQARAAAEGQSDTPRHIWDIIVENKKDLPPEDFAALPKDGLSQIDHSFTAHPREPVNAVFADTFYWAAVTNIDDLAKDRALTISRSVAPDGTIRK
jgi:hypothetical protein